MAFSPSYWLSIKTRIETDAVGLTSSVVSSLLIDYPLKQGLKRIFPKENHVTVALLIDYPLKQGLKRMWTRKLFC